MAERRTSVTYQQWEAVEWPVSWSAIWVGGLAALATGLIFGLGGTALGAYSETRIVNWHKFLKFDLGRWPTLERFQARVAGRSNVKSALRAEHLLKDVEPAEASNA